MKEPKDGHIKIEQMVYNVKKKLSIDCVCEGLPKQFTTMITYIRDLKFEQ